jgi:lysophospholipase L1-like esterase
VTVGGSAAECLYLDSGKTWPDLIARGLTQNGITAWVGNAGISGRKAEHHLAVLENLPFDRYGVDVVIELVGVNDLASFLKHDGVVKSTPSEIMAQTFIGNPRAGAGPWYKRTRLWQTAKRAVRAHRRYQNQLLQNVDASMLTRWRTYRREATQIRETLPDLREGLSEYAGVLNRTVDVARARGLRLILLTQPALWRADLSPREDSLLWSGGVGEYQREGGHPYYSAPALEQGLMAYNRVLLDVCERRGVECIDLASKLPKDLTVFYDDAHFNEAGARTVADIVVAYLTANP